MILLQGKKAIITSGSRGIGKGIAEVFAKNGSEITENYGNYKGVANSVCFGKTIG